MMGGATEDDNAMKWFLKNANGGDVLVLRTSGSNGYNRYMYSSLGVKVNSVETIVFNSADASKDPYVLKKIKQAEAIWFAGGDQWEYVSYWRDSPVDSLINTGIFNRNIVVGGTSAGMAILGKFYFSAAKGTVYSENALANPYQTRVSIESKPFIVTKYLDNVITDTHYDNPDRKGRHVVFMARILTDYGVKAKGIACDEYTAVCIDTNGNANVYGEYPTHDDNAYFIQVNCQPENVNPEVCSSGIPITWNLNHQALKVFAVKGTATGSNSFNLNDWKTGKGGEWMDWFVEKGQLSEKQGSPPNCVLSATEIIGNTIQVYPNPANNYLKITGQNINTDQYLIEIYNMAGQKMKIESGKTQSGDVTIDTKSLKPGVYFLQISSNNKIIYANKFIIN
jgi:cyanophycinase-like exopeptidase